VPPTGIGFPKLSSMHDESGFANLAVFNVQPRFIVVLPLPLFYHFFLFLLAGRQTGVRVVDVNIIFILDARN
jgi:hypothetical protein